MSSPEEDRGWMSRGLELAVRGQGFVEPNPMVGCVIVRGGRNVGEGWHQRFGGPHAEVEALTIAGESARGATMYVTLEPCCHQGKTPPGVDAILAAGLRRVVIAEQDPFPLVDGGGIARLRQAGIEVSVGQLGDEARELNAPFRKLVVTARPWVIAKWAMSLDGKIATRTGDSQWISNGASRAIVHQIRGRMDGILVGRGTVEADNPLLTARPQGPRIATRIVLDSAGSLRSDSNLVRSIADAPVLVVTGPQISSEQQSRLQSAGCEVLKIGGSDWSTRLPELLNELGRRRMTNVLVEGGAQTLGGFVCQHLVDEIQAFISPRIIGGAASPAPIAGSGVERIADSFPIAGCRWQELDGDLHCSGRIARIHGK